VDVDLNLALESVEQVGLTGPVCVEPETPVREVFDSLRRGGTGSILVCRDGVLIGIFTERDALRLMARGGDFDVAIEDVMVSRPMTVRPNTTVATAVQRMSRGGYRRLPVVDSAGRPLGVVQASSIVHYLAEHFPKMVYNLPPAGRMACVERDGA